MTRDALEKYRCLPVPLQERFLEPVLLGRGEFGTILRVYDTQSKQQVALKLLDPRLELEAGAQEDATRRFNREAKLASRLDHPHVVRVLSFGFEPEVAYIVYQYIRGKSLLERMRDRRRKGDPRFPPTLALELIRQLLEGLEAVHALGILHRDLKPANLLVDPEDQLFLADFGLSKSIDSPSLTATGQVVATANYAPPEILVGEPWTASGDLYAVGQIFYELVTGSFAFPQRKAFEILQKKAKGGPLKLPVQGNPKSRAVAELIAQATHPDPGLRPSSAREFLNRLDAIFAPEPPKSFWRRLLGL